LAKCSFSLLEDGPPTQRWYHPQIIARNVDGLFVAVSFQFSGVR
jgi:hypothetical protein